MGKRLLFLFLFLTSLSASGQDWQWVKDAGGPNYSESKRIATDADGNSYVTGNFATSVTFGTTTLTGGPNGNAFISKYNNGGQLVWAKQISGTSVVESVDIAADAAGNTYITGNFKGTTTVGAFTLTSPDDRAAFVAKFDATGNVVWAKQANSTGGDDVWGENITVDGSGNVYVAGIFFNSATFGATIITASRDEQVFIAKYAANGNLTWVKMAGGLGSCFTHDIATDNSGNLYLTGQFWLTATFGSTTLYKDESIITSGEIFIAKYDAYGNALWAKQAGGAGRDAATGIVVDSNGNSYITGFFQGSAATFGTATVTGSNVKNIFLAKYSATGGAVWVKTHQSSGDAEGTAIDLDASGNIYTAGYFEGSATFGNATLISYGGYDMFFAKYDANGTVTGAMQAGGSGMDIAKGLDVSANGGIYFTGDFRGPATFGNITLTGTVVSGKLSAITSTTTSAPRPTLVTSSVNYNYLCPGSSVNIPFTTTGEFGSGNVFTVELSDASGSFGNAVAIGSGTQSPIAATVPSNLPLGKSYRIRTLASEPAITGSDNGADLTVAEVLPQPGSITGASAPCIGASGIKYAVAPVPEAAGYTWAVPAGWSIAAGAGTAEITVTVGAVAGNVSVRISNTCESSSASVLPVAPVSLNVSASAAVTTITAGTSTALSATGADTFSWAPVAGLSNAAVANPIATPATTTTYTVTGYRNGCTSTAAVTITVNPAAVQEDDWAWVKAGKSSGYSPAIGRSVTTDAAGNVYVTGDFGTTIQLGASTLISTGNQDVFVAKYDASGNMLWAKSAGGSAGNDYSDDIAVDRQGNVYVAGTFGNVFYGDNGGTATFDAINLTSSSKDGNMFLVKYDANGNVVWAKQIASAAYGRMPSIGIGLQGEVYVAGSFTKTVSFDAITLTVPTDEPYTGNAFIAKYDTDGNALWAKQGASAGHTYASGLAVGASGNVYVTGIFSGLATFGTVSFGNDQVHSDLFVAKYNESGNVIWAKHAGGGIQQTDVSDIVLDSDEQAYVAGWFDGIATFGTTTLRNFEGGQNSDRDIFIAKFDNSGSIVWARQAGTAMKHDEPQGMAIDGNDNIYITGYFGGSLSDTEGNFAGFGPFWINSFGKGDIFVAKYNTAGQATGVLRAGGNGEDQGTDIAADTEGRLYITGYYSGSAGFGENSSLQNSRAYGVDVFVAKLNAVTAATPPNIETGTIGTSTLCPGAALEVPFTASDTSATGINFSAQLSDGHGSFATYTSIGSGTTSPLTTVVPVNTPPGTGYRIRVVASAPFMAGTANKADLAVANALPQPDAITGDATPCPGESVVYAVASVSGATAYTWSVPAGWAIQEGQGTAQVMIKVGAQAGYISAVATKQCETSAAATLHVYPAALPNKPGAISADRKFVCRGTQVQYSVAEVAGATSYHWEVPAGWEIIYGQGGSFMTAVAGVEAGKVSVTASNSCGASLVQTLSVVVDASAPPPAVIGATGCVGSSVTLQASGAWTDYAYYWYTSATGNDYNYIAKGTTFKTPPLTATTTYYVSRFEKVGGCESTRAAVTATVLPAPEVNAGRNETFCFTDKNFRLGGQNLDGGVWSGVGVTANGEFNPASAGVGTHDVTYTITQGDCIVSATKTITVTPEPILTLAPYGQVCSTVQNFDLAKGQLTGGFFSGIGVDSIYFDATVAGVGTHLITYTYNFDGGCTVSTTQTITVATCTGLPESAAAAKLVVYPNPTSSDLNIALHLPKRTALTLRLSDTKGQKLYEQRYPQQSGEFKQLISLRDKPKGVYLLQLVLDDGVITRRVVVE
ncbi:SBBP repeat-containing protein [Pontibacter sp. E15-1]|uniref:SBBP repeat-containing protein n=1 Tax=Pontibacter sp. E15-1 TaxID=2919918 RepID=UPI001F4F17EB|nr:SBBP repeat-containing protein [Pontibacter sp. E15-1]MCJ8163894.1 SBBP repeat-containing protein [Pontibacter sp. E15-1]